MCLFSRVRLPWLTKVADGVSFHFIQIVKFIGVICVMCQQNNASLSYNARNLKTDSKLQIRIERIHWQIGLSFKCNWFTTKFVLQIERLHMR